MEELKTFYEECEDTLEEHLLKARSILRENNEAYKQLLKNHKSILEEYKNLSLLLEDNENNDIEFNAEECKILQKLIQINIDMKQMEEKEIFFLGAKENYFYLKKIGVLK